MLRKNAKTDSAAYRKSSLIPRFIPIGYGQLGLPELARPREFVGNQARGWAQSPREERQSKGADEGKATLTNKRQLRLSPRRKLRGHALNKEPARLPGNGAKAGIVPGKV
jgi:hypothetical protein